MNMNMNMVASLLAVVLVATSTMYSTYAFEYIVGNTSAWVVPNGRLNNWAAEYEFQVGDTLVFNVVKDMTMEDYEAKMKLEAAGNHYLICSFPQNVAINVCSTLSPTPSPPFMPPQPSPSNTNTNASSFEA